MLRWVPKSWPRNMTQTGRRKRPEWPLKTAVCKRDTLSYLMLYKGKLDQIIMCLYVEVICKIQTMYVTNLRSGLEYIVKEQNDLAKDYYKKIAQPVRV